MFNNADIYCRSSKIGLATRKSDFLCAIQRNIEEWKENQIIQKMDFTSLIQLIVQSSHRAVVNNGWDENEMDGVAWFIGNYADIITKARSDHENNYDTLFKMAFNLYFQNRQPQNIYNSIFGK